MFPQVSSKMALDPTSFFVGFIINTEKIKENKELNFFKFVVVLIF
jgi:hypothetical protein